MYEIKKVGRLDFFGLKKVARILYICGKDMANKYDLHHWDNPFIKSFIIACICSVLNDIYLLYDDNRPVATFMTKKEKDSLHFEKLGTIPSESGRGIGSYCLAKIEEVAKNIKCKKVVMEVYETSQHAIQFYEPKGYRIVGMTDTLKYKEVKMEKCI